MIRLTNTIILLLILFVSSAHLLIPAAEKTKITADKKESEISYTMVHPLHEWTGTSRAVNCVIIYNAAEDKIETVAAAIALSSFDSKNANRDSHALEVLDAIKYPSVKFTSQTIVQNGDSLLINGNLTFHNVTKSLTIKAERKGEGKKIRVDGSFDINMTEYDVEPPSLMGLKTKEEITLSFSFVFPESP